MDGGLVIYAQEPFLADTGQPEIFLAGPTPRHPGMSSWRPDAMRLLREQGFDDIILNPEPRNGTFGDFDYTAQIDWEWAGLDRAHIILFWVPRQLDTIPAFTTNVEFGMWCRSGKVVFGGPPAAPKNKYLRRTAELLGIPVAHTLQQTVENALQLLQRDTYASY